MTRLMDSPPRSASAFRVDVPASALSAEARDGAPRPSPDGFVHPTREDELVALVLRARREGRRLRVRGSAHSIAAAIHSEARLAGRPDGLDVMLDRYGGVRFDDAAMEVTAQAGCHLGVDPRDPTGMSTHERSLTAKLDARGWALPDLGGVTHQTVSGFLSTGSCGGTIKHSLEGALVGVRLIDGTGRVWDLRRGRDPEFDAVACSMGLLGIISEVTFRCVPRYDVIGRETIELVHSAAVDLFSEGPEGLEAFFRTREYARMMWWPQRGLERLVTWQARRMTGSDYGPRTGPRDALVPKPYRALGDADLDPRIAPMLDLAAQHAGGLVLDGVDAAGRVARATRTLGGVAERASDAVRDALSRQVLPRTLGAFVPLDRHEIQRFWDSWCNGLPMDNPMSEAALPTTFTELFVPIDRAHEVMRVLEDAFERDSLDATGTYIFELYASAKSSHWMHPSYGQDSLRVDVFWFERSTGDMHAFFGRFWDLLLPFGYRLHWGKHVPRDRGRCADHLRNQLPRWNDFLDLRRAMDPSDLFLTPYWRETLGIDA